jgi:3'-phosphoadenosine 5'-phosphosulfate sulfotransferase (PAPS reductase)/FAD synthetase
MEKQREALVKLKIRQRLPPETKVEMSLRRISDFGSFCNEDMYVSFSGGKDSTVLLDLVRQVYPGAPAVFCNTGLEYPETVRFVKEQDNVTVVHPDRRFDDVVREDGWPVVSKLVSNLVEQVRSGKDYLKTVIPECWRVLLEAPFKISPRCCKSLKIGPMKEYQKETKRRPVVGVMATDSYQRTWSYARSGGSCNIFADGRAKSMPLMFWTCQDILWYVRSRKLEISPVYGDVVETKYGNLQTTGCERTGCIFCCFGLHLEGRPGRFEMLAETHPGHHRHIMEKLGLREILGWLRENGPDRYKEHFRDGYLAYSRWPKGTKFVG